MVEVWWAGAPTYDKQFEQGAEKIGTDIPGGGAAAAAKPAEAKPAEAKPEEPKTADAKPEEANKK